METMTDAKHLRECISGHTQKGEKHRKVWQLHIINEDQVESNCGHMKKETIV